MLSLIWYSSLFNRLVSNLEPSIIRLIQPPRRSLALSIATDLSRSKSELITENALLRQQLIVLHRQIKKPRFIPSDRLSLVLLATRVQQ